GGEIVGVVGHVKGSPDQLDPEPQIYVPIQQNAWWRATRVARPASGPATALVPEIRAAMARVDKTRALTRIQTLDEIERGVTARWRFRAQLVGTFAVLALTVALFGVPPLDPVTFGAAAIVLAVAATVAATAPTLRAMRVDPVIAFRQD